MKIFLFLFIIAFFNKSHAQIYSKCNIIKNQQELHVVDYEKVKCLAVNSTKKNTIIYTFGIWCKPCIYHLPQALGLELNYETDVYVLIIDPENSSLVTRAINFFKEYDEKYKLQTKILLLQDFEGKRSRSKKYKSFLAKITPSNFENINDMSKYIVLNNKGETIMVTNWKDSKDDPDWSDDGPLLRRLVIPLLTKKNVLEDTSSDDQ